MKKLGWPFALFVGWALTLGAYLELSDQEAYYWSWAKMPALCYFDHPPLLAWSLALTTRSLGNGTLAVRLPALLGAVASFAIFSHWARRRAGEAGRGLAASMLLACPFFLMGALISLPDAVMTPFALLAMIYAEDRKAWKSGLSLGIAALGKWTVASMVPGVSVAFLRKNKRGRDVRGFFIAGGTALLLQTPVLLWNARHDWISFLFHLKARHASTFPVPLKALANFASFVGAQFLNGGLALIFILGFWFLHRRRPTEPRPANLRMSLGWWIWPAVIVFGYSAVRGEIRFYWTSLAFFPFILWCGEWLVTLPLAAQQSFNSWQRKFEVATLAIFTLAITLPVGAYLRPLITEYKSDDLRHSPRGDMIGWRELVKDDLQPRGLLKPDVAFLASDIRLASQIAWAAGISDMRRISPVEISHQYLFWPHPDPVRTPRVVFVEDNRRPAGLKFNPFCPTDIEWHLKPIMLLGKTVKVIRWGVCDRFRILPQIEGWTPNAR